MVLYYQTEQRAAQHPLSWHLAIHETHKPGHANKLLRSLSTNFAGHKGVWRNGSASDSRSEGWEFESLCPHCASITRGIKQKPAKHNSIISNKATQ